MKKRYTTLAALILTASVSFAQQYETNNHLVATVMSGTVGDFKATEVITAANRVESGATAHYAAGQSVTLQPGFVATAGSVFSATIEVVTSRQNPEDQTMTVVVYPNPFSDVVSIGYNLPAATTVKQTLTDISGQLIQEIGGIIVENAGAHRIEIKGDAMQTGVYLLQLQTATERRVVRLLKK